MTFSAPVVAGLVAPAVAATIGLELDLSTGVQRLLRASGPQTDPLGNVWTGVDRVSDITGLTFGLGRRKQPASVVLSGLDPAFFSLAQGQTAAVRGRRASFWLHVFKSDWSYADNPVSLGVYIMDKMTATFDGDAQTATLALSLEPLTAGRFRAPSGYLTHEDQQRRWPAAGDRGLERVGKYVVANTIVW